MSSSQVARKGMGMDKSTGVEETEGSSDVTITVNSSGNVSVTSATTTPTSDIYVSAAGSYAGVCARVNVTLPVNDPSDEGLCKCSSVVGVSSGHMTASNSPYTVSEDASGPNGTSYTLAPVNNSGVVSFGSVGDIRVGTGG